MAGMAGGFRGEPIPITKEQDMRTLKHFKITMTCTDRDDQSHLSVDKEIVTANMNNAQVEAHKLLNRLEDSFGLTVDQVIVREIYKGAGEL
tara:strand:+ start:1774 stop:2046 length:273 start_codon:yes stop_codon:yes gene_type:complete